MAELTSAEFSRAITILADEMGLQRLRDKLVRLNALVTRRKIPSAAALADQLYMLTAGLRRQVPATYAFHALWTERINTKLGEDGEKEIEKLAEDVNACLDEKDQIIADKTSDLETALATYRRALAAAVGEETARLDMILKAVPAVAKQLREEKTGDG
jgi:hypothetical protein